MAKNDDISVLDEIPTVLPIVIGDEMARSEQKFTYSALDELTVERERQKIDHARDQARLQTDRESAEIDGLRQDIDARKEYSNKIFFLIVCWLYAVVFILWACGKGYLSLDNSVILALIGGTTINVLGLFLVVANYLFPKK